MRRKVIWIVGEAPPDILQWMADRVVLKCLSAAAPPTNLAAEPAAILFFQSHPGQFSQQCLHRWRSRAPFATLVLLSGVFCERKTRGSKFLNGMTRIAWHQWPERLPRLLGLEQTNSAKGFSQHTRIAVSTARLDSYLAVADACESLGFQSIWQSPDVPLRSSGAGLWLCDEWPSVRADKCEPAILLSSFPRPEDLGKAADLGIRRVVAKPLHLADLRAAMTASLSGLQTANRVTAAA